MRSCSARSPLMSVARQLVSREKTIGVADVAEHMVARCRLETQYIISAEDAAVGSIAALLSLLQVTAESLRDDINHVAILHTAPHGHCSVILLAPDLAMTREAMACCLIVSETFRVLGFR